MFSFQPDGAVFQRMWLAAPQLKDHIQFRNPGHNSTRVWPGDCGCLSEGSLGYGVGAQHCSDIIPDSILRDHSWWYWVPGGTTCKANTLYCLCSSSHLAFVFSCHCCCHCAVVAPGVKPRPHICKTHFWPSPASCTLVLMMGLRREDLLFQEVCKWGCKVAWPADSMSRLVFKCILLY